MKAARPAKKKAPAKAPAKAVKKAAPPKVAPAKKKASSAPKAKAAPPKAPAAKKTAAKKPAAPAAKKKVAAAPAKTHAKSASAKPAKVAKAKPAASATPKQAKAKVADKSPAPSRNSKKKVPTKPMTKPKKTPAAAEAKPATKSKAKPAGEKNRSAHLKKLLALREARTKITTRGKSDGLSSSVVAPKPKAKKTKSAASASPAAAPAVPAPVAEAKKKKAKRKAPYTKAELKELRAMLLEERESLLRDLRQLDEIAESGRQTTHATFSSHQADAASDSASLESTFIQRRYEEERFAAVSEALLRIEEGSYGFCEFCAEEQHNECATCPFIPVERLRAKPFARMCVQLRTKMEKRNRR